MRTSDHPTQKTDIMPFDTLKTLLLNEQVEALLHRWERRSRAVIEEAVTIQQIPAPTFDEHERSDYTARRFERMGLTDVHVDGLGNVTAWTPNAQGSCAGQAVMVSAHLDTVFPMETPLTERRTHTRIYGPGIGDNSLGLAALLNLAQQLKPDLLPHPVVWVATVGEEGLGDLRGMRKAVEDLGERIGAAIILEGIGLGKVYNAGLGVRRLKISVEGPGGHSWLHPERPSAVHQVLRVGAAILEGVPLSKRPRTTLNIGLVEGGTSINTRAARASIAIDMRATTPQALTSLEERVRDVLEANRAPRGMKMTVEVVGDRPSAHLSDDHPLVQAAQATLEHVGYRPSTPEVGSTDANIPLAAGIPSVCIGITVGGDAHTTNEYILTEPVAAGMRQLSLLTLLAAHHLEELGIWV